MATAHEKTQQLQRRLSQRGMHLPFGAVNTLRRAECTLHSWAEGECGMDIGYASFFIERDAHTNIPYRVVWPHSAPSALPYRIPDREKGALQRVRKLCTEHGLYTYHQTDPRGCALYVAKEPLNAGNYSDQGIACRG